MYIAHTMLTTASPEKIWKIWTDVNNWKKWEVGLRGARIKDSFKENVHGVIIPERGPKAGFKVAACDPNFSYTVIAKFPFAAFHIHRFLGYDNSKTTFTHEVWAEGPLAWVWWRVVGKKITSMLPKTMSNIKALAEMDV